jgi:hypothetical protein
LKGYGEADEGPVRPMPDFRPIRQPGVQLPDVRTREDVNQYLTPMSFFKLFFTVDLVQHLCNYTNIYARLHGPTKKTLYKGWTDLTVDDMYMYFALLMYMAVECYWKKASLFHGLWARYFMSKLKFKAIQSFLKVLWKPTSSNGLFAVLRLE